MKVVILHHDLEGAEVMIKSFLENEGIEARLLDIREATIDCFDDVDLVLNRVYASVANRDFGSIEKTLSLLKALEKKGMKCINSYKTSLYDYNKYEAYKAMKSKGIDTPETLFIDSKDEINEIAKKSEMELGFPLVVKRNTGGRGKDVSKVFDKFSLIKDLEAKFDLAKKEGYGGGFIIQNFVKSLKNHDCRIGLFKDDFLFAYGRTLIAHNSPDNWLASISRGSELVEYSPSELEINKAKEASRAIGAEFNEMDILFGENGPVIVEHNPTPVYYVEDLSEQQMLKNYVWGVLNSFPLLKNE